MTAARNSVRGTPALAQRGARLVARAQMFGERVLAVAQSAQVDDARHAGRGGRLAEGAGGAHVAVVEVASATQTVHEVVGHVDVGEGGPERGGGQHVGGDDLDVLGPGASLQPAGVAHHAAHGVAAGEQGGHEPATHVAVGAGDEDTHQGYDARAAPTGSAPTAAGADGGARA